MLNRHAIVLYLGVFALFVLGDWPQTIVAVGWPFLALLVGLLLDQGSERAQRQLLAHLLQGAGVLGFLAAGAVTFPTGRTDLALCLVGIGLLSAGVVAEQRLSYAYLRMTIALHALGDLLVLAGFALAPFHLKPAIPPTGWVFIAIAGALSLYAVVANVVLQLARLRNPQAGWRFRLISADGEGLRLKTPGPEAKIPWRLVEEVKPLDARHLLLVLPSALPAELKSAGLPLEELRASAEAPVGENPPPPEKYGFILHEQELGQPVALAAEKLKAAAAGARRPSPPG